MTNPYFQPATKKTNLGYVREAAPQLQRMSSGEDNSKTDKGSTAEPVALGDQDLSNESESFSVKIKCLNPVNIPPPCCHPRRAGSAWLIDEESLRLSPLDGVHAASLGVQWIFFRMMSTKEPLNRLHKDVLEASAFWQVLILESSKANHAGLEMVADQVGF